MLLNGSAITARRVVTTDEGLAENAFQNS